MAKKVRLYKNQLHVVPLPGKGLKYVSEKTREDDAYNCQYYKTIVLHLGAVDLLNILQGKDPNMTPLHVVYRYTDLHSNVRKVNPLATIIFFWNTPYTHVQ